jgi:hypothetical protein
LPEQDRVPSLVCEAAALGFEEIVVELPWELGIDVVRRSIASARASAAG